MQKRFNLTTSSFWQQAKSEDLVKDSLISLTEVTEAVKELPIGKAPGMDEIQPVMPEALDIVGLFWLT